jgi:hypothetical protein
MPLGQRGKSNPWIASDSKVILNAPPRGACTSIPRRLPDGRDEVTDNPVFQALPYVHARIRPSALSLLPKKAGPASSRL